MDLATFLATLNNNPSEIDFEDTIAVIEANYQFTPTAFHNGDLHNDPGQNNGSCKILFSACCMNWENHRLWPVLVVIIAMMCCSIPKAMTIRIFAIFYVMAGIVSVLMARP